MLVTYTGTLKMEQDEGAMILKFINHMTMSFVLGFALLVFSSPHSLSENGWNCYRNPVPGWTPCVCTHNPGEPLCFWSSEPTCSPCDPSTICHIARPFEGCFMHQGCAVWAHAAMSHPSPKVSSRNFEKLCDGLIGD
jgi:hypothetical protein